VVGVSVPKYFLPVGQPYNLVGLPDDPHTQYRLQNYIVCPIIIKLQSDILSQDMIGSLVYLNEDGLVNIEKTDGDCFIGLFKGIDSEGYRNILIDAI
jgi:hypothetical protein